MSVRPPLLLGLRGLLVAAIVCVAAGPFWMAPAQMRLLFELLTMLTLAQSWNLLAGYTGIVSVGQHAFIGIGGYTLFVAALSFGLHPLAAVPVAGVVTAGVAVPLSFVIFRLRGPHLTIGTWVIAEVFLLSFAIFPAVGAGGGLSLPPDILRSIAVSRANRESVFMLAALALALIANGAALFLLRSSIGLGLRAVKDNEAAARSLGVKVRRTKFTVYVIAAAVNGAAGALIFLGNTRISPEAAFNVIDWTAYVIFAVVIGGIGRLEGPIIGTIVFFVLRSLMANLGSLYLIILGLIAIVIILVEPQGLAKLVERWTGADVIPYRRKWLEQTGSLPETLSKTDRTVS
ncbi:branched-chain amino acid ABC transporter permease [Rhizobium calliandrae]|uniref:Branched-chain amino acid ABC transporter permease n=1 Tax=Rhizobium calliandrae TaxID=1312182 RepID=A0ABT7KQ26_9HYPH|nr:branched-chain amino acid ABC transporter permease [Rhizobium calliandrae]MDL2410531.1 branched-chain amino acid ABC transporter permease [Rhizobium calliandrae]